MEVFTNKEHILVAANYRWPVYATAFTDALEHIGVKITRFSFEQFLKSSPLQIRMGFGPNILSLNIALQAAIKHYMPTICLIWTGLSVWPLTIKKISQYTWVTSYTNDDPFGARGKKIFWRNFKNSIGYYHSHHVYRDINVHEYNNIGIEMVNILRSYYVPWMHYPDNADVYNKSTKKAIFIGHGEPNRIEALIDLANSGVPIDVYGPIETWRSLGNNHKNINYYPGTLGLEEYRKIISNSAICIGFLSRDNRDDYTRRYFEIPACGGFMLAERTKMAQSLFIEGKEADFFSSSEELVNKCKYYLNNDINRKIIAKSGLLRCRNSGYDISSRAQQWLSDVIKFREIGYESVR